MKRAIFLFVAIGIFSCSKKNNDATCTNYVKGDLVVGIKGTASIEDVFSLFNTLGLQISRMSGFFFASPYPKDSLTNLIAYLNTKSYIKASDFSASAFIHYQTGIINVTTFFFDMSFVNQQDWIATEKSLNLVDTENDTKDILLKVPVGQEVYWLNRLKEKGIVTWAELNCIEPIHAF